MTDTPMMELRAFVRQEQAENMRNSYRRQAAKVRDIRCRALMFVQATPHTQFEFGEHRSGLRPLLLVLFLAACALPLIVDTARFVGWVR